MKIKINMIVVAISLLFYGNTLLNARSLEIKSFTINSSYDENQTGIFTNKSIKVLTTQNKYSDELLKYSTQSAKNFDFSDTNVVLIDMGKRLSSGYSFDVNILAENNTSKTIKITYYIPGNKCIINTVITNPYKFIIIDGKKDLLFSEIVKVKECN